MRKEKLDMFVVTHKPITKRINKKGYHYIGVGPSSFDVELKDNTLDNIAFKNASFCELTAQYWVYKNYNTDRVGFVHYRRFFYNQYTSIFRYHIYSTKKLNKMLDKYDVLVTNSFIINDTHSKNVYDHYVYNHYQKDLNETKKIIEEKYPSYISSFDKVMKSNKLYLYNMFVMKKTLFDEYMSFLFNVLFELEKRIDISKYSSYQKRIFGFLSERLFMVFLTYHQNLKIKELGMIMLDDKQSCFKFYINKIFNKITGKNNLETDLERIE